jgi:hypothetical protein
LVRLVPIDDTPRRRKLGFLRSIAVVTTDLKEGFAADVAAMFD